MAGATLKPTVIIAQAMAAKIEAKRVLRLLFMVLVLGWVAGPCADQAR
jgi:hypothetical protein